MTLLIGMMPPQANSRVSMIARAKSNPAAQFAYVALAAFSCAAGTSWPLPASAQRAPFRGMEIVEVGPQPVSVDWRERKEPIGIRFLMKSIEEY